MDERGLQDIVQGLTDLELALFLCLAAREHCLIETTGDEIGDLATELALICENTFNLSYSVVECSTATTIEDIHNGVLTADARKSLERPSYFRAKTGSSSNLSSRLTPRDRSKSPIPSSRLDEANVVNIVIAQNFNLVSDDVQVQALQLMRNKQLVTEMGALNGPGEFLFLPLVVREGNQLEPPLNTHLSENLMVSLFHGPEDGYAYLEGKDWLSDDQLSASSVVHTPKAFKQKAKIDYTAIIQLREMSESVTTSAEVARYIQDIVVFLRLSRAVAGGVSAKASSKFSRFAQFLAPLHGIDYLTPSIVALAVRKVFRHRIIVASPDDDRSLQYGSSLKAVAQVLEDVTPDSILDGVLALEPPL